MGRLRSIKIAVQNWLHLKCTLWNKHQYVLEKKYDENILKLNCKKCNKKFGVDLKSAMIFAWDRNILLALTIYENNLKDEAASKQLTLTNPRMKVAI